MGKPNSGSAANEPQGETNAPPPAPTAPGLAPTITPEPNLGPAITILAQGTSGTASAVPEVPGYEILGELGRGGMGVVYMARQLGLNRIVALKMILAGVHANEETRRRFLIEAEAVARLQHPNIVQVYEIGEHEGLHYFSLEYCPGGSLATRLDGTPLNAEEAAALIETLALAVHAAHEHGVIHRDLKPANILLSRSTGGSPVTEDTGEPPVLRDVPKITDFGLAKSLNADAGHTATGAIMGTPSYMAPEQAQGQAVGTAADIYALGAILYELLTGRPPFRAATPYDTIMQVVGDEPVAPSRLQPRTSRDLETICLRCLQKDPRKRYASAHALAEDVGRFRRGEPIRARPDGPIARVVRWCRRNPIVSGLTALVVLSLIASWVNLHASLASVESLAVRNKLLLARSVAVRLDERVRSNAQGSALLSRSADVRALLTAPPDQREELLPVVQETLENVLRSNEDFSAAFVLDANGNAQASTNPEHLARRSYAHRDYFREARKGRAYQSRILIGTSTNKAGMYYSAPVQNADRKVLGVVVIKMEADTLCQLVEDLDVGEAGHAFVVDEDGIVIAPNKPEMLWHSVKPLDSDELKRVKPMERFGKENVESLDASGFAVLHGASQPGYFTYMRPGDGRRVVAYAPLSEKDWVLAIDLDAQQFSGTRDQLAWRNVTSAALVVGLLALLALPVVGRVMGLIGKRTPALRQSC